MFAIPPADAFNDATSVRGIICILIKLLLFSLGKKVLLPMKYPGNVAVTNFSFVVYVALVARKLPFASVVTCAEPAFTVTFSDFVRDHTLHLDGI
jgi:hypothetical protein